jgi:hypothetical protein
MTCGIGFLNKNGIVLAVDSRATDEHGAIKSDNAQKLFQLDDRSGLIIAGGSKDDDLFYAPIRRTIEQVPVSDSAMHRDTILHILAKKFCDYFLEATEGYVHFIFGNYDDCEGYLLLKCGLGYVPVSPSEDQPRRTHQAAQAIYQTVSSNCPKLYVHVVTVNSGNQVSLFSVGAANEVQIVGKYMVDHLAFPPQLMAGWSLEKTCQALESAICKIAGDYPLEVNTNIRVAVIDRDGFRWVKGEGSLPLECCCSTSVARG